MGKNSITECGAGLSSIQGPPFVVPGFVAEVVALAFGLAASSFFPAILLGIFTKRMNHYGAVSGMIAGIGFTLGYILYFKLLHPELNSVDHWWLGVSPEGIGTLGMVINFVVAGAVARFTPPPPPEVQKLVEEIRIPRGADAGHELWA